MRPGQRYVIHTAGSVRVHEPSREYLGDQIELARPHKKRDLAKLRKELKRQKAFITRHTARWERRRVNENGIVIDGSSFMDALLEHQDAIMCWYGARVTHVMMGPAMLRISEEACRDMMQFTVQMEMNDPYRPAGRTIYGLTIILCPWMEGMCPVTDPRTWPKPI